MIRCRWATTTKLHEPVAQVQCCLWIMYKCFLHQILREIMLLFVNNVRRKPGKTIFSKRARSICNLHSCYNFALGLYEYTLVSSQSGARNFLMYIIVMITTANSSKWLIKQGYSFPKYYREYACKTFSMVITGKTSIYPTQSLPWSLRYSS